MWPYPHNVKDIKLHITQLLFMNNNILHIIYVSGRFL